jgi:hypothetical protein
MVHIEVDAAFLYFIFQNRFAMIAAFLEHSHRGNIRSQYRSAEFSKVSIGETVICHFAKCCRCYAFTPIIFSHPIADFREMVSSGQRSSHAYRLVAAAG